MKIALGLRVAGGFLLGILVLGDGASSLQAQGGPPGKKKGVDFPVIVSPGAQPGTLKFSFPGCTQSDCPERAVEASNKNATNTVTWNLEFPGETVLSAVVTFTKGTPFFREKGPGGGFVDDPAGGGAGPVVLRLKAKKWKTPEGVKEIDTGDRFKYEVRVRTQRDGEDKVYEVDPVIIVR